MSDFRFGWWTTGRDEAAVNLFDVVYEAVKNGEIKGDFCYLFLSRREGEGAFSDKLIRLAQKRDIPLVLFSAMDFEPSLRKTDRSLWRTRYHQKLYYKIAPFNCPLVILAGYMWVLSPEICSKVSAINLHPALPGGPAGTWQEVIWQLLEGGAEKTGAMMHLVTPELDKGPAVTFFAFPIRGKGWDELWEEFFSLRSKKGMNYVKERIGESLPLFKKIRQEGEIRELPLIVETLKAFSDGRLVLENGKFFDEKGQPLSRPLDLSRLVDEKINKQDSYMQPSSR